jgi:hypothetical protein
VIAPVGQTSQQEHNNNDQQQQTHGHDLPLTAGQDTMTASATLRPAVFSVRASPRVSRIARCSTTSVPEQPASSPPCGRLMFRPYAPPLCPPQPGGGEPVPWHTPAPAMALATTPLVKRERSPAVV